MTIAVTLLFLLFGEDKKSTFKDPKLFGPFQEKKVYVLFICHTKSSRENTGNKSALFEEKIKRILVQKGHKFLLLFTYLIQSKVRRKSSYANLLQLIGLSLNNHF